MQTIKLPQQDSTRPQTKFVVAQLGARGHYAVPRILHQVGMLGHLYTDICAVKGFPKYLNLIPQPLQSNSIKRLTGRIPHDIDPNLITTFSNFGLEYILRLRKANFASEMTENFLWAGKTFGRLVLQQGLAGDSIYVFNTAGLELLEAAKKAGLRTVLEQTIAPYQIEQQLLQEEQQLHPGWENPLEQNEHSAEYIEREQQEWSLADLILCGSEFVREGIQQCQGPVDRCAVIPYGIHTKFQAPVKARHSRPLRVLTVGAVGLRKGTPYVLEAARRLKGKAIFRLVGPVQVLPEMAAQLQEQVELVGQIPRSQILEQYRWADVFLLPSICEGSATATYEALACGLPILTTFNTGAIVEDGLSGFLLPIRDVDAIVERLERLQTNAELLINMSQAAIQRSTFGGFTQYGDRLLQVL